MERKTVIYILIFIVISAFFLRVLNAPYIIYPEGDQIIFTDNDAPYHALRIIDFATGVTGQIQFHDPRSYYPEGHISHWSPGFDFVLGLLGKIFYLIWSDEFALKIFISLLIPVFGSLTLTVYYLFVRSFMNRFASLVATMLLGLLPFHITVSYFSVVDHHVAEYLFIILLYLAVTRIKEKFGPIIFALIVTAGFWVVPGFLVDYIVLTGSSVFVLIICRLWKNYSEFARRLFIGQAISFVILFPSLFFSYYGSLFSMRFDSISLFQGVMTFIGATVTGFFYFDNTFDKKIFRPAGLVLISIIFVSLVIFLFPGFSEQLRNGLFHMTGSSHLRLASEFNALGWGRLTAGYLQSFWPLLPLGIVVVCYEAFRKKDILLLTLLVPLIFYGIMAFIGVKFFRYFLIFGILAGTFCCVKFYELTLRRIQIRRALIVFFIFLIVYGFSGSKKVFLLYKNTRNNSAFETLSFISKNYFRGEHGTSVFALWDLGHKIIYYTDFYNMDNPFLVKEKVSHTKDFALFNFSRGENEALSILEKYDSKIVIMESVLLQLPSIAPLINKIPSRYISKAGTLTSFFVGTLNGRLYFFDGTFMKDNSGKGEDIPAVSSFRLVYETKKNITTGGLIRPVYKVFERIEGAEIKGVLDKSEINSVDQLPTLSTTLMTNTGRKFLYVSKAKVSDGKYFFVKTPYAAPGKNGRVIALTPYTLIYGSQRLSVIVKEEDVKMGKTIFIKQ